VLRKLVVAAALISADSALAAPAASASSTHFAGVYPNFQAAQAACHAGIAQGRWWGCSYENPAGSEQTYLWVQVG
jgi:hypothetical protein